MNSYRLLIGGSITVVVGVVSFVLGQANQQAQSSNTSAAADVRQVDRYRLVSIGFPPDVYLLDSFEGRVWQRIRVTDAEGKPTIWNWQQRIDGHEQWLEFSRKLEKEKK